MIDVIVIGSGPGGVNAAYPLCEAGLNVVMLDYGNTDNKYKQLVPRKDFTQIRLSDEQQHRYFLGDDFEGVLLGNIRVGTKLTPPRLHVVADSTQLMPVDSKSFVANESLAMGGLAESWGAGLLPFREEDFSEMPISLDDLTPHYKTVAGRIGISGGSDDIRPLFGDYGSMMPPVVIDSNAQGAFIRYKKKKHQLNKEGFFMGRAPLAVCTEPHRGRGPYQYRDMDYWTDTEDSVYRPRYTLEELKRFPNFSYKKNRFVLSFKEREDRIVEVTARIKDSAEKKKYPAGALILAAGTMSSARIVLRSLQKYDVRIPILTNSYTYIPSINFNMLGVVPKDRRSSHGQLLGVYFPSGLRQSPVISYLFSYRSLLTFKLLKEAPLPQRECLKIMRRLMNYFGIITIFHKDRPSPSKYCVLHKSEGNDPDRLEINYKSSYDELTTIKTNEIAIQRFYRRLGCWPLKAIRRAPGSSIHNSGTLPMSKEKKELTCDAEGRLFGTNMVYLADGSVLSPLPSNMLTFTIMANANRVGTILAQKLKQ